MNCDSTACIDHLPVMCNCGSFDLDCALPPEAEPQQLSQDEIANYRDVPLWWTDHNDEPTWGTQVEEAKQARQGKYR